MLPGHWFNIKMLSYQYRKSHCGDKTAVRSSHLHNGISYTGQMSSLYSIGALVSPRHQQPWYSQGTMGMFSSSLTTSDILAVRNVIKGNCIAMFSRTTQHIIWVRSRRCGCLVTWFCHQLIAKPGNKKAAPSWPDPYVNDQHPCYATDYVFLEYIWMNSSILSPLTSFQFHFRDIQEV